MSDSDRVVIGDFEKNRRERVIIALRKYKGIDLVDTRIYYLDEDDEPQPSSKGISLKPEKLDSLIEALTKARAECVRCGLLSEAP